ncbi:hypothetical protein [Pontibacter burrus]|uniref:Fibronectin type-III domain-containing protein n=1 Tax=Pontibacter burrus TaxID=2704466 RepID=A0A6B3LX37_9BACT|nr:hypothetical protein [Pontibacter burrus]NEM98180.1 hypothetical protein [Pontibacter burrus]
MTVSGVLKFFSLLSILFLCVSCLGDDEEEAKPNPALSLTTTQSNVKATFTTLEVKGEVNDLGKDVTARGIVWSLTSNPTTANSKTTESSNSFSATIEELHPNTTYFVKVYATTPTGTYYSDEVQLKTKSLAGTTWSMLFKYSATIEWYADVAFKADGTTVYDEPDAPGVYLTYGTWKVTGNQLTYDMDAADDNPRNYVLTGTFNADKMSGTFTHGPSDLPWTAELK